MKDIRPECPDGFGLLCMAVDRLEVETIEISSKNRVRIISVGDVFSWLWQGTSMGGLEQSRSRGNGGDDIVLTLMKGKWMESVGCGFG